MTDSIDLQQRLEPWGSAVIGAELSGFRNGVWSIRLRGEQFIARLSPRTPAALNWELDLLETLRSEGFNVPVPVPTASGERQVNELVVFTFIAGRRPGSREHWQLVSHELRRLHELTRGWPQRPGFRTSRDLLTEDVGGDVVMSLLPPGVADLCRQAWSELPREPESLVHGDPSPSNILIDGDKVGLLDWDEARVDSPLLDLGAMPDAELAGLSPDDSHRAQRATVAWEVAVCWELEPDYARRRLKELRALGHRP